MPISLTFNIGVERTLRRRSRTGSGDPLWLHGSVRGTAASRVARPQTHKRSKQLVAGSRPVERQNRSAATGRGATTDEKVSDVLLALPSQGDRAGVAGL